MPPNDCRPALAAALVHLLLAGSACTAPRPDYARHVAPILERRCARCHGGTATVAAVPPSLRSYEEARAAAAAVALAVRRRSMPPPGPDATGLCGAWREDVGLTADEIGTLARWAEHGAPAGSAPPSLPPVAPEPAGPWLDLGPAVTFVPGLGAAATRCFLVAPPPVAGAVLTGFRVRADAGAVRHGALYELVHDDAVQAAERLDAAAPGPGWPCAWGPDVVGAQPLIAWSWTRAATQMPAGTGLRVSGRPLVIAVASNLPAMGLGHPLTARAQATWDDGAEALRVLRVEAEGLRLAAGRRQEEARSSMEVDRPLRLLTLMPVMHGLGRVVQVEHGRACIAHFGHWDPWTQRQPWTYERAVALEAGDRLTVSCTFDTVSRTSTVGGGEGVEQERCAAVLYAVTSPAPARGTTPPPGPGAR